MAFDTDDLNSCLRGELAAIETYEQALEKIRSEYGSDPKFQQLEKMLRNHEQAATQLQSLVRQNGGEPDTDSGAWGAWANTVMGASSLFGDKAALKALKEGEESGIKQYRSLIDSTDTPADVRDVAMKLMKNDKEHCTRLDTMMETVAA
ncbi:MAG: DUF2383 domain-containing protein [Burkholderiaceae bacterium]